jgi:plasmid replication initiation protein
MDKEYLVTKSNYFIMNSSYDLSLEEQKIILTLASMVQPNDEEFKPYKFKINDFIELLGVENQAKYTEIPKITKELMKKVFEIHEGNKLIQTAWLSGAVYEKGTGYVELTFSPYLKPYMLKLNSMFTKYKLANVLSMRSKYSPRIYEILKCNEFKKQGYVEIEVEDLRKLLKADNIYPLYADFKRFILMQTQKELKKISDISFDFEEVKTGRKVTSIKFYIKSNCKVKNEIAATAEKIVPELSLDEDIKTVKTIIQEDITDNEAQKILNAAAGSIEKIKEKYLVVSKLSNVHNIVGAMITAIKENWTIKSKNKVSAWSYSGQRQYDFKELEKKLLGWENSDDTI